jgi:hypothetical protein
MYADLTTDHLTIGDTVLCRGNFGTAAPRAVIVNAIEITDWPREKYGEPVDSAPWELVNANRVVVTLDNGHWAYGAQLERP